MKLYHFTCAHGRDGIGKRGTIKPLARLVSPRVARPIDNWVWMTADPDASRDDLGLTGATLPCDRMEFLYSIGKPRNAVPWIGSPVRAAMSPVMVGMLESHGRPECWWVSRSPQKARLVRLRASDEYNAIDNTQETT
ncbi:MAG: hypothetical protein GY772_27140 [bacterium]|nr:hypothetical protein [bacterium]